MTRNHTLAWNKSVYELKSLDLSLFYRYNYDDANVGNHGRRWRRWPRLNIPESTVIPSHRRPRRNGKLSKPWTSNSPAMPRYNFFGKLGYLPHGSPTNVSPIVNLAIASLDSYPKFKIRHHWQTGEMMKAVQPTRPDLRDFLACRTSCMLRRKAGAAQKFSIFWA